MRICEDFHFIMCLSLNTNKWLQEDCVDDIDDHKFGDYDDHDNNIDHDNDDPSNDDNNSSWKWVVFTLYKIMLWIFLQGFILFCLFTCSLTNHNIKYRVSLASHTFHLHG